MRTDAACCVWFRFFLRYFSFKRKADETAHRVSVTLKNRTLSDMNVLSADRALRRELSTLSKRMPACMVQQISVCLKHSHALTDHEIQTINAKPTEYQQATCLMQTLLRKGSKSCLLFFQCLSVCDRSLFQHVTRGGVNVSEDHIHVEDCSLSGTTGSSPPSVITIYNSLLMNCIIGKNNNLVQQHNLSNIINDAVAPTSSSDQQMTTTNSTEIQHIQMDNSRVQNVIIGDNNQISVTTEESESENQFEDLEE